MLYSLLCATLWASTGIFVKLIGGLGVNQIIVGRFLTALVLSLLFIRGLRRVRKQGSGTHTKVNARRLGLASLMTLYYVCATYGFYLAPVSVAALLIALAPLFTLLIRALTKQRIHRNEWLGFALAFIGLLLYFRTGAMSTGSSAADYTGQTLLIGGLLALVAALLRALFSHALWSACRRGETVDIHRINLETLALGSLLLLPVLLLPALLSGAPPVLELNSRGLLWLLALGAFSTFLPNLLNNLASLKITPTLHNVIGMSTPLSASLMAWALLGETQTVYSIGCMLLALAGICVATRIPLPSATSEP